MLKFGGREMMNEMYDNGILSLEYSFFAEYSWFTIFFVCAVEMKNACDEIILFFISALIADRIY